MLWAQNMRPYLLKGHERPLNFLKWVKVVLCNLAATRQLHH